ncbi:hypothetical protein BDK51DRAFT_29667 [Blyttiomyces helicus]|uniref:Uncharacterized protein n=1 Tax=Blyttiomyces helicus TaxID=388810 RepID=A0A4V1IS87_9FUNG|nr:hypothetical protein BDK51DRAFT_29667 [Blyttiomyces helicus]|eukprot:RKO92697.1 hypothetical protein BDK51DRAFT_29667 [Blyttiomyces helicus]
MHERGHFSPKPLCLVFRHVNGTGGRLELLRRRGGLVAIGDDECSLHVACPDVDLVQKPQQKTRPSQNGPGCETTALQALGVNNHPFAALEDGASEHKLSKQPRASASKVEEETGDDKEEDEVEEADDGEEEAEEEAATPTQMPSPQVLHNHTGPHTGYTEQRLQNETLRRFQSDDSASSAEHLESMLCTRLVWSFPPQLILLLCPSG